eukprot:47804_1
MRASGGSNILSSQNIVLSSFEGLDREGLNSRNSIRKTTRLRDRSNRQKRKNTFGSRFTIPDIQFFTISSSTPNVAHRTFVLSMNSSALRQMRIPIGPAGIGFMAASAVTAGAYYCVTRSPVGKATVGAIRSSNVETGQSIMQKTWEERKEYWGQRGFLPVQKEKFEEMQTERAESGASTNIQLLWRDSPIYARLFKHSEPEPPSAFRKHSRRMKSLRRLADSREHRQRISLFLTGFQLYEDESTISRAQLTHSLVDSGASEEYVHKLMDELDVDDDGMISMREYLRCESITMGKHNNYIHNLFDRLDFDNNGNISMDEFRKAITEIDDSVPIDEIDSLFHDLDTDNNGTIEIHEFVQMFVEDAYDTMKQ